MPGTKNSRVIKASAGKVFQALTDPRAIEKWQVPGEMKGKIHRYELRERGQYEMSLYYPANGANDHGKSAYNEDRFTSEFLGIVPLKKIVQKIHFHSKDPELNQPMIMQIDLESEQTGTKVTFTFTHLPAGVKPEDNEAGTISSLEKLAQLVEG